MLRPIAVPAVLALLLGACLGSSRTAGPPAHDDLSDADVAMAARAMHEALENLPDRQTLGWRNQASGYGGSFRPYRTYVSSTGLFCRQYAEELLRDGQKSTFRYEACRAEDGGWVWL
ncbi:MAG TPA: RT0821/Lpp0805 family surface protein [Geminicoccaceae bacterium]|nr:RT0821/Lpp0805 family surface protein [Geminicoccaceae bacterium]